MKQYLLLCSEAENSINKTPAGPKTVSLKIIFLNFFCNSKMYLQPCDDIPCFIHYIVQVKTLWVCLVLCSLDATISILGPTVPKAKGLTQFIEDISSSSPGYACINHFAYLTFKYLYRCKHNSARILTTT